MRTVSFIIILLLSSACSTQGDRKGNAEGYGVIQITTVSNRPKNFPFIPESFPQAEGVRFEVEEEPKSGRVSEFASVGGSALYSPALDFVGSDQFTYRIIYPDGEIRSVIAYVEVRPCLRLKVERENADNVHIISVNGGSQWPIRVRISRTPKPIVLYLTSISSETWELELAEGAKIERVEAWRTVRSFRYENGQSVEILPTVLGVSADRVKNFLAEPFSNATQWEPEEVDSDRFPRFIENIRSNEGKNETSFQGCDSGQEFSIPFTQESIQTGCRGEKTSYYHFDEQECGTKCKKVTLGGNYTQLTAVKAARDYNRTPELSPDRLSIGGGRFNAMGTARSNLGLSCGKYYFEVTVEELSAIFNENYIGVTTATAADDYYGASDNSSNLILSGGHVSGVVKGDIVGVALDLDRGVISYSRNGNWLFGANPENGTGAAAINIGIYQPLFIRLGVAETSRIRANFGSSPFHFTAPDGFLSGYSTPEFEGKPTAVVAPIAHTSDILFYEGSEAMIGRLSAYSGGGSEPLHYELVAPPIKGVFSWVDDSKGLFRFTPEQTFPHGLDSFSFRVRQGELLSDTAFVTMEIAPLTEAPQVLSENAEVHILSHHSYVSEAPGLNGTVRNVHIYVSKEDRPIVLVLYSLEGKEWEITKTEGANIEQIIVTGQLYQRVLSAPEGVPVRNGYINFEQGQFSPTYPGWKGPETRVPHIPDLVRSFAGFLRRSATSARWIFGGTGEVGPGEYRIEQ